MTVDEIIKAYTQRLQDIYDKRIAGDHTFSGVLRTFLDSVTSDCESIQTLAEKHDEVQHPSYDFKHFIN